MSWCVDVLAPALGGQEPTRRSRGRPPAGRSARSRARLPLASRMSRRVDVGLSAAWRAGNTAKCHALRPVPVRPDPSARPKRDKRSVGHESHSGPDLGPASACPVAHDGAAARRSSGPPATGTGLLSAAGEPGADRGARGLGALPEHRARLLGTGGDEPVEVGPGDHIAVRRKDGCSGQSIAIVRP